jgi:hypothetical protein
MRPNATGLAVASGNGNTYLASITLPDDGNAEGIRWAPALE